MIRGCSDGVATARRGDLRDEHADIRRAERLG